MSSPVDLELLIRHSFESACAMLADPPELLDAQAETLAQTSDITDLESLALRRVLAWYLWPIAADGGWILLTPILNRPDLVNRDDLICAMALQQRLQDPATINGLTGMISGRADMADLMPAWHDWLAETASFLLADGVYPLAASFYHMLGQLAPDNVLFLKNLAECYRRLEQWQDEYACLERALVVAPDDAELWLLNGHVLHRFHSIDDALKAHQRAHELAPQSAEIASALEFTARRAGNWDIVNTLFPALQAQSNILMADGKTPGELPFQCVFRYDRDSIIHPVINAWAKKFAQIPDDQRIDARIINPDPDRRLRIAYLSGDYYDHATMHLLGGLFRDHDRNGFEVLALSCGRPIDDHYRQAVIQDCDEFIECYGLGDYALARHIHACTPDILVDLRGMTGRMYHLACRPAPVIASWIGFPGTTGADFIDYLIADPVIIPPKNRPLYPEAIAFMPVCYQLTDPEQFRSDPSDRCNSFPGIADDTVVLGSFCHSIKINPDLWDAWLHILAAAPRAVLAMLIPASLGIMRQHLITTAKNRGIDPDRLLFLSAIPKRDHLKRIGHLDLCLDTWPCGGHTTTTDALWAGVPVLTRNGHHFAGRVAQSILHAAGLPDLVAPDRDSYIRMAIALVDNDGLRQQYRNHLANPRTLPLFDSAPRIRELEQLYRRMWQRKCAGLPPEDIHLDR